MCGQVIAILSLEFKLHLHFLIPELMKYHIYCLHVLGLNIIVDTPSLAGLSLIGAGQFVPKYFFVDYLSFIDSNAPNSTSAANGIIALIIWAMSKAALMLVGFSLVLVKMMSTCPAL